MNEILIIIASLLVIVFVITTIMIYAFLKERNVKLESFVFIRIFIFKYVSKYKTITKNETGKIGYLYYLWIISINLALLCIVLSLILK
jgi:hypothetical protein